MSHSEICPVCMGNGKRPQPQNYTPSLAQWSNTCNGCGGLGWVTVQDSGYMFNTKSMTGDK